MAAPTIGTGADSGLAGPVFTSTVTVDLGSSANRALWAQLIDLGSLGTITACTLDGASVMGSLVGPDTSSGVSIYNLHHVTTLTGSKVLSATWNTNGFKSLIAIPFSGIAQTTPFSGRQTSFGLPGTTPQLTIASDTNSVVVMAVQATGSGGPMTPGTGSSSIAGIANNFRHGISEAGASSVVIDGTISSQNYFCSGASALGLASAPTLTAPTGAATGNTTANAGATTDTASGTLYAAVSASAPSAAQIKLGQDSTGAATTSGNVAVSSTGTKTVPLTGVATGSRTVWLVHNATAGDSNVVSATWTQTAAPVLSSPTNTPGSTTALIGATTTVSSGTAYFLPRVGGSAASDATIISTGQTSPVTNTTPNRTVTGLTASTANNFVDIVQVAGVTTSNVVSTAAFTTTSSGDTTPPTLTGSIVIGTVTSSSIQFSWPAGSDNVAVTSYEVSSNGGSGYVDAGNVLTYTFTGLTASTSYGLRVRAKDAAGNVSTPALAATQSTAAASGVGSISLNNAALYTFRKNNGAAIVSTAVTFFVSNVTTGALIGSAITGLSTNAQGLVTTAISNASMLAGTTYRLSYEFSSGEYGSVKLPAV